MLVLTLLYAMLSPTLPATPLEVIGLLTEQAKPICDGTDVSWGPRHFEVGFVPLDGFKPPAGMANTPIIVRGQATGQRVIARHHPCAPAQWRNDWVLGLAGVRSVAVELPRPASVTVADYRPVELTAMRHGSMLEVAFKNPLDRTLANLQLVVRYEGCYGKPLTGREATTAAPLEAGQAVRFRAPVIREEPKNRRGRWAVAHSVMVTGTAPHALVDLDVPLARLGVPTACPKRPPNRK